VPIHDSSIQKARHRNGERVSVRLPEALKRRVRTLPQWAPIAMPEPQEVVEISMVTAGCEAIVTRTSVVASLRPFTLAIGLDEQMSATIDGRREPELRFTDSASRRTVAELKLRHVRTGVAAGATIGFFEVRHGTHYCLRRPYAYWNRWRQNRAMRKNRDPGNFSMPPESVQNMMIFYICPRPVVLVSVEDDNHSNVFPMDLIGSISPDHFTLALRSTSQSVATMTSARRVALSDIAATDRAIAYRLGAHHKNVKVDWSSLPFGIKRSDNYSLPYPDSALRVREIDILNVETIGSHTFFVTRIASERKFEDSARLFHTSGIYQHYRSVIGRPLQPAV
jgi:flavin reductase (DIM6/NTAB) family NADH-FMN oxidoreductase RutF